MGRKIRYYFDPLTLTYQIIPVRFRDRLKRVLYILAGGLVFSTVVIALAFKFLSSPKERILLRQIEQYKVQVEAMNHELDQMQKILADLQNRDDNIYRVIFETEPIPSSVRQAGIGGSKRYENLEGNDNLKQLLETAKKLDKVKSQIYVQSKSFDEVFELAKKKEAMVKAIPAIQPVSQRDLKYISSYFGYRIHPFYKTVVFHEGIDFTAPKGTKVYATGDGKVKEASLINLDGFGKKIIIDHGFGYQTVYAHLNSLNVKPGQNVKRGDVIATVGTSGLSTGPHLHYEVIYNHQKVNPAYFMFDIDPATFQDIIRQSSDYKESSNILVAE